MKRIVWQAATYHSVFYCEYVFLTDKSYITIVMNANINVLPICLCDKRRSYVCIQPNRHYLIILIHMISAIFLFSVWRKGHSFHDSWKIVANWKTLPSSGIQMKNTIANLNNFTKIIGNNFFHLVRMFANYSCTRPIKLERDRKQTHQIKWNEHLFHFTCFIWGCSMLVSRLWFPLRCSAIR